LRRCYFARGQYNHYKIDNQKLYYVPSRLKCDTNSRLELCKRAPTQHESSARLQPTTPNELTVVGVNISDH
jgi:hypothetical protein